MEIFPSFVFGSGFNLNLIRLRRKNLWPRCWETNPQICFGEKNMHIRCIKRFFFQSNPLKITRPPLICLFNNQKKWFSRVKWILLLYTSVSFVSKPRPTCIVVSDSMEHLSSFFFCVSVYRRGACIAWEGQHWGLSGLHQKTLTKPSPQPLLSHGKQTIVLVLSFGC